MAEFRGAFSLVVARSFGPPAVVAECGAPFLCPGGILVVSEPPPPPVDGGRTGPEGGRWPGRALAELGLVPQDPSQDRFGYQVLRQAEPCPDRYPRRTGIPSKRPLYRAPG
jgi:16S rRNA (guanine527-N7)-methyltransferase